MKYRYIFLWFLLAFLLQSTFVLNFGVMGLAPNFILCISLIFAFYYEIGPAMIFAFTFGLLQDMNFSVLSGPSALILPLIVLAMEPIKTYLYKERIINVLIISTLGTLSYYGLHWSMIKIFKGAYSFMYMAKNIPTLLLMNIIVMLILYFILAQRLIAIDRNKFI